MECPNQLDYRPILILHYHVIIGIFNIFGFPVNNYSVPFRIYVRFTKFYIVHFGSDLRRIGMVVVDCHVHSLGSETVDSVLKGMDSAGIDKAVIFSPYPASVPSESIIPKASAGVTRHLEFSYPSVTSEKQKEAVEFIAGLRRGRRRIEL